MDFWRPGYSFITCASNGLPYPGVRNVGGGCVRIGEPSMSLLLWLR